MNTKPAFIFTFANDLAKSLQLDEEWKSAEEIFQDKEDGGQLIFNLTTNATKEDIWNKVERYHNQTVIFHYGGHSDGEGLFLEDSKLNGKSLAVLLGQEQNLKLAFLNGCSNLAQIDAFFAAGVKAIIATDVPIEDDRAIQLSSRFYKSLVVNKSIREAFESAAAYVNANNPSKELVQYRGLVKNNHQNKQLEWGLYVKEENVSVLNWRMTDKVTLAEPNPHAVSISQTSQSNASDEALEAANSIASKQNLDYNQKLLAAQRHLYTQAKKSSALQFWIAFVIAIVFPLLENLYIW
ncbi:MAG: S-4TM family putative pore-forming effector [Bacteroidota bacterium]